MSRYLNKDCKLIPFTGNVLNSFVLSEKGFSRAVAQPKLKLINKNVLLIKVEDGGDKPRNTAPDLKKYNPN